MAKILFIQGMNTRRIAAETFHRNYLASLRDLLVRCGIDDTTVALPTADDVDLLYWTDLIPTAIEPTTKGLADTFEEQWLQLCRALVLKLDAKGNYDMRTDPGSELRRYLRAFIEQAALYMQNYPAAHRDVPQAGEGLRDQVLARFDRKLSGDTRIVIGHSLGSVIAYEGLRSLPHRVDLLLTVGSPMGTPSLIYDRLEGEGKRPWPNVERWCNVHCTQDVFFVPVPELQPKFHGSVEDIQVKHGAVWDPDRTHRLDRYFQHNEVGTVLAEAWRRALGSAPP